ncbi:MAG: hypothetical protein ACTS6G_04865 [Candidatus Hodgkinia cicadicola]
MLNRSCCCFVYCAEGSFAEANSKVTKRWKRDAKELDGMGAAYVISAEQGESRGKGNEGVFVLTIYVNNRRSSSSAAGACSECKRGSRTWNANCFA